jgi:DNA-binding response OmpR family regulator
MSADRCILIVDDDLGIRRLLVTYLGHRGFQMLEARNGREALAEMRVGRADLVILDLMMPDVSGMDVLRERAADPSLLRIPTIVVTANIKREAPAGILDKHVWAVLAKPFDLDALLTAVITCLEEHPHVTHPLAA